MAAKNASSAWSRVVGSGSSHWLRAEPLGQSVDLVDVEDGEALQHAAAFILGFA